MAELLQLPLHVHFGSAMPRKGDIVTSQEDKRPQPEKSTDSQRRLTRGKNYKPSPPPIAETMMGIEKTEYREKEKENEKRRVDKKWPADELVGPASK